MKKLNFLFSYLILLLFVSCKEKPEVSKNDFFPALSYIQSQVALVDTSLYTIYRLEQRDSSKTDTIYVRREEFRQLANDFLSLPDITKGKLSKDYKEEEIVDETLNAVILTYLPQQPDKVAIQRQEVVITPNLTGESKVKSIYFDYRVTTRDSSVEKKLLWQNDRYFQVLTLRQKPGQPEESSTLKVVWEDPLKQ
jgi:hypothetical protein